MKLDFFQNQIIISESESENFLHLQDLTTFNLCFRLRNKKYEIPLIALPILLSVCKKANFKVEFSDKLKEQITIMKTNRKTLEELKEGKYTSLGSRLSRITKFIIETEQKHGFLLTPSQRETVIFGIYGRKILIANYIGTGKTITANMIAKYFIHIGVVSKILILVPASLVKNFYNDYIKFFGNSGIMMIGKETKKARLNLYTKFKNIDKFNFLVTNYEKCLFDYEELKVLNFEMVIVDEFHKLKNFLFAKRSENFFKLINEQWNPKIRIPMSGTPIENKLFDLYPIFKLISGGSLLGGQKFFESNFVEYKTFYFKIEYKGRKILKLETRAVGFKNLKFLINLAKPYIIRKKLHLPVGKYENTILIDSTKSFLDEIDKIKKLTPSGSTRYHRVRQFICSPDREGYKENQKLEELNNILSQTDEKVVIFSFYLCSVETISKFLNEKKIKYLIISGKTKEDPLDTIRKFSTEDYKVLICTDKINAGHNIQVATILVEYEFPMKPSTSQQRIGRIYRKGQLSDVKVFSFVMKNTVEEKIYDLYQSKKDLIEQAIENMDQKVLKKIDNEFEQKIMKEFD